MADLPITSDEGATPIVINDPTTVANVANVKAASTASVVGDNALVVALSPNSPVPTGTNNIGVTGVAQGSTTSGEHGDLIQGAVTTAAPAYTTAQTSPLSLTLAGALRIDGSAVTQPVSLTSTTITGTVAVTQSTSPWVVSLASTTITGTVTIAGAKTNNNAAPGATNVGVLPALANAASPSWTEGDQVLESVDLTGRQRIRGTLTNNNAAPATDQLGVLTAVAAAAAPTWTTGDQVLLSEDLAGNLRVKDSADGPVTSGTVAANSILIGGQFNTTLPTLTNTQQAAVQTDSSGRLLTNAGQTGLSSVLTTGSLSTVGTTAVQMHSGSILAVTGITVRSSPSNTAMIYIGPSTVTANTAAATDGMPLKIGESITLALTNINLIYLIATAAAQEVFWVVL